MDEGGQNIELVRVDLGVCVCSCCSSRGKQQKQSTTLGGIERMQLTHWSLGLGRVDSLKADDVAHAHGWLRKAAMLKGMKVRCKGYVGSTSLNGMSSRCCIIVER